MSYLSKKNIFIIILILFSLLINQYYGNKGIFPVDSFAHFDTGFRILLGEHPFKNYWIVSGPIIDYFQAILFYLFGTNWQSYILHASIINAVVSVATFLILIKFNLNIYYSFFYSIIFSVLAYPTSGTPFVDHHSAFFSLLAVYSLILAIKDDKKFHWVLFPLLLSIAFLSKQVPSSYVIISIILILITFSLIKKKYYWIKYSFLSFASFIIIVLIFGNIQGIKLSSFLQQYIFYPQTIGAQRISDFEFTFRGTIGHFKFIYIALIPLFFLNLQKIIFEKGYYKHKDFYYFLVLILFTFSLIFHQIITRNQTFIFFLIPLLFAFSHIKINSYKPNLNKFVHATLILICLFSATKYHIRFNENRKFHELNYVNFDLSLSAKNIDKKFKGLKWITPEYKEQSKEEIATINDIRNYLSNDNRKKMLMTNYSFFSILLNEKLFSQSRWFIFDGTDYPMKGNKYYTNYQNLLKNLIKNNEIAIIYTIYPVESSSIYTYINKNCFKEVKISEVFSGYELQDCFEING